MASIKSKIDEEAQSCFTSMIDIVFLLLIYFVVQPFKAPELRMMSYLPKDTGGTGASASAPQATITLKVMTGDKPGKAMFSIADKEFTDANSISQRLYQESGGDKTVPVTLTPDAAVQFKWVLKALDQCTLAEMTDVKFAAP